MVLPGEWILKAMAALAGSMLMVAAGTVVATLLLPAGPRMVAVINDAALHLVGEQGSRFVLVAGATIRNVSRGVIGVALLQALVIGVALLGFGVPHAGLLALAVLVLGVVQIGPWPAVAALLAWFWIARGPSGEAAAFSAVMVAAASTEYVVKPFVLGRGLETPMPVILIGLLGGTLAFGLLGLFLGPVLLALAYELLLFWWKSIRNDQR
jgi:predicted PurR-regulated permease PerM